jgi:hypothetical protein
MAISTGGLFGSKGQDVLVQTGKGITGQGSMRDITDALQGKGPGTRQRDKNPVESKTKYGPGMEASAKALGGTFKKIAKGLAKATAPAKFDMPGEAQFKGRKIPRSAFRSRKLSDIGQQYEDRRADRMRVTDPSMIGAQIDMGPQDQFRAQQAALSGQMMGQAMGTGPSLAEMNFQRAQDRSLAGQVAAAASQRGGRAGLQQLQLQRMAGDQARQAAVDMPMARLAEQQQMAGLVGGLAEQGRAGDIGLAQTQAGLTQESRARNLQAALESQAMRDKYEAGAMAGRAGIEEQLLKAKMGRQKLLADQHIGIEQLRQRDAANRRQAAWEREKAAQALKGAYASAAAQGAATYAGM